MFILRRRREKKETKPISLAFSLLLSENDAGKHDAPSPSGEKKEKCIIMTGNWVRFSFFLFAGKENPFPFLYPFAKRETKRKQPGNVPRNVSIVFIEFSISVKNSLYSPASAVFGSGCGKIDRKLGKFVSHPGPFRKTEVDKDLPIF